MSFLRKTRRRESCLDRRFPAAGFTLIELVVTLAVAAIIAAIAVPAMQSLINSGRLNSMAEELTTAMQLARSEAIRRATTVTMCGSANGTTCANGTDWNRWIIVGRDNAASDAAGAEVITVIRDSVMPAGMSLTGPAAGVHFNPSGLLNAETTVSACLPNATVSQNQRVVTVLISGSARSSKGSCS
ncbi:type IV fimbrial biogenesis protein FimT [Pseudoxanthomonas japonensis]|uniref:GspH/FimT family pseudopilin n=1 Tax=Pseudoxanthomonas japonensis TaxID=69284 RepID=UPI002856FB71|nr:GspH/FimT family pseudopilin [Pseudoxanthomonas japonensis]MDR7067685.1 type IV fimbrial biogenesis protein FimT [Pseudoxanthomonas japonensis]